MRIIDKIFLILVLSGFILTLSHDYIPHNHHDSILLLIEQQNDEEHEDEAETHSSDLYFHTHSNDNFIIRTNQPIQREIESELSPFIACFFNPEILEQPPEIFIKYSKIFILKFLEFRFLVPLLRAPPLFS